MKKNAPVILCLAAVILAACGEETRNGTLSLLGTTPVRIVDEGGKTVEFPAGPTKVVFGGSGSKFTVAVSQGKDRQAKFSGKVPSHDGWNFTVRGKDIGQPVDFTSARSVDYYGQPWRQMRSGGPCGYDGTMLVEDEYQKCSEDWTVTFADANSQQGVGNFRSALRDQDCLISSRDLYCQGERYPGPYPPYPRRFDKANDAVKGLEQLQQSGVKFD